MSNTQTYSNKKKSADSHEPSALHTMTNVMINLSNFYFYNPEINLFSFLP